MESLKQDLRYAWKMCLTQPMISLMIVLTLALGTGATCAVFSAVYAQLLRPLPYPDQDKLVAITAGDRGANGEQSLIVPALAADLKELSTLVRRLGGYSAAWTLTLTGLGDPTTVNGAYVTPGLLEDLGFHLVRGRSFTPAEEKIGAERVALVTRKFATAKFGGIEGAVGKQLTLDNQNYLVVGVTGDDKRLPNVSADVFLPFSANEYATSRFAPVMNVIGVLEPPATLAQAQQELDSIGQHVARNYPILRNKRIEVVRLRDRLVGNTKSTLLIVFAAVVFLVLITCVNIANLLLSRATAREREIALRAALGASRRRLIQQLLTESVLLALLGGIAGVLLAALIIYRLVPSLPSTFALSQDIGLDGPVLAFALLLSVLTGLFFGLVPALHASTPNLIEPLRTGNKAGAQSVGGRLRNCLVVSEIALALIVLVAAGLLIRSFWALSSVDPGFRTSRILTMDIFAPDTRYRKSSDRVEFYARLMDSLKSLPGVESVGAVNRLPLHGSNILVGLNVPGSLLTSSQPAMIDRRVAEPGYFQTMAIPLLAGRYFTSFDGPDTPKVAIVNRTLARRFWPHDDPIGHQAVLAVHGGVPVTIVGVIRDVLHEGMDKVVQPELYVPYTQAASEGMTLVIRTTQPPSTLTRAVRSRVWALDHQMPLDKLPTMEEVVSASVARPRFRTILFTCFAFLALLLSAIGIYGVVSYSTSRRIPEIGIRMALGADYSNVLKLILGEGLRLTAIGVAIGLAVSVFVTRFLSILLFNIKPNDPLTMSGVALLLIVVALSACYFPARRAMRVNPVVAIRVD